MSLTQAAKSTYRWRRGELDAPYPGPWLLQPLAMGQMVDVTNEVPQPEEGRVLSGPLPRFLESGEEPQEVTQKFSGAIH